MARSDGLPYYFANLNSLVAAGDDGSTLLFGAKSGTTSGAGNQGTANQAHMVGQAGTAINQVPRAIQGGRQQ